MAKRKVKKSTSKLLREHIIQKYDNGGRNERANTIDRKAM